MTDRGVTTRRGSLLGRRVDRNDRAVGIEIDRAVSVVVTKIEKHERIKPAPRDLAADIDGADAPVPCLGRHPDVSPGISWGRETVTGTDTFVVEEQGIVDDKVTAV